jgi:hypothetical protein
MVTSSAVVGSSAISRSGLVGERHGDHHALALAAGELMRVGVSRRSGLSRPDLAQELDHRGARRGIVDGRGAAS